MSKFSRVTKTKAFVACGTTIAVALLAVACGGGGDSGPSAVTPSVGSVVIDPAATFQMPAANTAQYQYHLAMATANAGKGSFAAPPAPYTAALYDPVELRRQWCYTAENAGAPPELANRNIVAVTKLFDNMWATGLRTVLQYPIQTESGEVFLLDSLNNTGEAQTITEPALAAIGLSNKLIGVMPTHGHGDHFGGSGYLQGKYRMPVYLGSADAAVGASATPPFTVTSLDTNNLNPQSLVAGGSTLTALSTPGHTPGTFSGVIPVKRGGQTYRLAFWGGTAMPGTIAAARQYLDGSERLYRLGQAQKIDGTMHTHPFVDGSLQKIDALAANPNAPTNPFLIGNALAQRSLSILRECSAAKVAQLDATAQIPAWHTTTTSDVAATNNAGLLQASAVVRNPFGWISGGTVKFTASSGQSCAANTNAAGVASCTIGLSGATASSVNAEFLGFTMADGTVELPSAGTATVR